MRKLLRRPEFIVTVYDRERADEPAAPIYRGTDLRAVQISAQHARITLSDHQVVRIAHDEQVLEELPAIAPEALAEPEHGGELVGDLVGQVAGSVIPVGRKGWSIAVNHPDVPVGELSLTPPRGERSTHSTYRQARDHILRIWAEQLDARSSAVDEALALPDKGFAHFLNVLIATIDARITQTSATTTNLTSLFVPILFATRNGTDITAEGLRESPTTIEKLNALFTHRTATEHFRYVATLKTVREARLVEGSNPESGQSDLPVTVRVLIAAVGPGVNTTLSAHLRESDSRLHLGPWRTVHFANTDFTAPMDAATLATMEDQA